MKSRRQSNGKDTEPRSGAACFQAERAAAGGVDGAFDFIFALAHDLEIRDVRAVLVLLALAGDDRSVASQAGVSVQFLSHRICEGEEACRHLVRSLQALGLVTRCGHAARTHLFALTEDAARKLECVLTHFRVEAAD